MTHALNAAHSNANRGAPSRHARLIPPSPLRMALSCALVLAALLASGCAGKPTNYYTLARAPLPLPTAGAAASVADAIFIELAPVAVPERLARPQMVLTKPGGQSAGVELLEKERWISSFELELRDALASGIAARTGAIDVTRSGAPAAQPVWRIAVQLRQFDAIEATRVDATFSWTARRAGASAGPGPIAICRWAGSVQVGRGIDALARGVQQVTDQAAQAIARHLVALTDDPAAPCRQ